MGTLGELQMGGLPHVLMAEGYNVRFGTSRSTPTTIRLTGDERCRMRDVGAGPLTVGHRVC